MQEHAAVFRTGSVLSEGCKKIDDIYNQTEDLKVLQFYSLDKPAQCVLKGEWEGGKREEGIGGGVGVGGKRDLGFAPPPPPMF